MKNVVLDLTDSPADWGTATSSPGWPRTASMSTTSRCSSWSGGDTWQSGHDTVLALAYTTGERKYDDRLVGAESW